MTDALLIGVACLTSLLTAITGIGGGLLLLSVMVQFLTPAAALPVHGVVQLASNASRAAFGWRHVRWELVGSYALGAFIGAMLGSRVVVALDPDPFRILLGVCVLVLTWMPRFETRRRLPGRFLLVGGGVSFLSMFLGAIGPLSAPFFLRENLKRDALVVTHAACLSFLHAFKVLAFLTAGFTLSSHAVLLVGMPVAATLGSWIGTGFRGRLSERLFRHVFRILVTLLGSRLIWTAAVG